MYGGSLDVRDPRVSVLVGVVFLLHAVHFAGASTSSRAELWLATGLLWLAVGYVLKRRSTARTVPDRPDSEPE